MNDLRTVMVGVLLLGSHLAGPGALSAGQDESPAERFVLSLQGTVRREDDDDESLPIIEVDLGGSRINDARLGKLAGLTQLKTLFLDRTRVTDAGLKELVALQSLERLDLAYTQVRGGGLT